MKYFLTLVYLHKTEILLSFLFSLSLGSCTTTTVNNQDKALQLYDEGMTLLQEKEVATANENHEKRDSLKIKAQLKFYETLKVDSFCTTTPTLLARRFESLYELDLAIHWYLKAIQIDSSQIKNHLALGFCLLENQQVEIASKYLYKAMELDTTETIQTSILDNLSKRVSNAYNKGMKDKKVGGEEYSYYEYFQFAQDILILQYEIDSMNYDRLERIINFAQETEDTTTANIFKAKLDGKKLSTQDSK